MPGKTLFRDDPSPAEQAAQKWHDEQDHKGQSRIECWCCCPTCKSVSPYDADARRAALLDIENRIRESQRSIRYPVPTARQEEIAHERPAPRSQQPARRVDEYRRGDRVRQAR